MSVRYPLIIKKAVELKAKGDIPGAKRIFEGLKYLVDFNTAMAKMGIELILHDPRKSKASIKKEIRQNEEAYDWVFGVYEMYDEGSEEYEKACAVDAIYNAAGLEDDFDPYEVARDICDQLTASSNIEHAAIDYGKKHDYSLEGFVWEGEEGDEDLVEMVMEEVKEYLEWKKKDGE